MPFRPETRPDPPTDERVAELAQQFPADTLVGRRARVERDLRTLEALDFPATCQDAEGCDQPSRWRGDGKCPQCGHGLFATGIAIYMCDHHHGGVVEALRWTERIGAKFNHLTATEVIAAITWSELP